MKHWKIKTSTVKEFCYLNMSVNTYSATYWTDLGFSVLKHSRTGHTQTIRNILYFKYCYRVNQRRKPWKGLKLEHCPLTGVPGMYASVEFIRRSKYICLYRSIAHTAYQIHTTKESYCFNFRFYSHASPGALTLQVL